MDTPKKSPTPPYVAYKTLKNFLEKFKQGVPSRVDRDLMGSMSGAAQSQVTSALKYLGFISENNLTQETMKAFVVADGEDRQERLKAVLTKSYPYLFDGHFDLGSATASQLREAIAENTNATGETIDRCIAFFKEAAQDAGVSVSRFITQKKPRGPSTKKRSATVRRSEDPEIQDRSAGGVQSPPLNQQPQIEAQSSLLLWGLFQRLPKPGTVWPKDQREQWTNTLQNVLSLEYKDE